MDVERFYGRSWLLVHYLQLSPQRRGQLAAYIAKVNRGVPSAQAGAEAFGDLSQLDVELSRYLAGNLFQPLLVPPAVTPPTIKIITLSAGASAMMSFRMRSQWGMRTAEAKAAMPAIVARAAPFADDADAQAELAEAAFDAGDNALAEIAATRALQSAPDNAAAMLLKGQAGLAIAMSTGGDPIRIAAARSWIVKANRSQPDSAPPLIAYYRSFLTARQTPSQASINGLMRAAVVVPESPEVRWWLAAYLLDKKDPASARLLLEPVAFSPHASVENLARHVIDLIDAKDLEEARKVLAGDAGVKPAED